MAEAKNDSSLPIPNITELSGISDEHGWVMRDGKLWPRELDWLVERRRQKLAIKPAAKQVLKEESSLSKLMNRIKGAFGKK